MLAITNYAYAYIFWKTEHGRVEYAAFELRNIAFCGHFPILKTKSASF